MMRAMMMAASLAAVLGLAGCDSAKTDAVDTAAAPAAPKSMARMVQMYAGQEQIASVEAGAIKIGAPGTLEMQASGTVDGPGFTNPGFLPRINAAPPKDGVYEIDVVADKPATAGAAAPTPIKAKGPWTYPVDHLKGVKFIAKTNSVVVMLPAG